MVEGRGIGHSPAGTALEMVVGELVEQLEKGSRRERLLSWKSD